MSLPPSDPAALHVFGVLLMIVVRFAAFILAVECLVVLFLIPRGVGSMLAAALFLLFFLILCWTFRTSANRKASS